MKTLLVITPGKNSGYQEGVFDILVAETGQHLASHYCSNYTFAYGDLYNRREDRKEEWTKKFGELEVKYIDETDLTIDELVRRNHEFYRNQQAEKTSPLSTKD